MDYKIISRLVNNWEFVIGVRNYYEVVSETGANSDLAKSYLKKINRRVGLILDIDDTKSIRKEIAYARDLIKSCGFKRIASPRNRIKNRIAQQLASYPRSTKDDVYVRDYQAEQDELGYRLGHCGGYDCMHFESMPVGEIWVKVDETKDEPIGDYIPELEEIAYQREQNRKVG